ncbi:unnamed protein product [Caenorhabditis nigoni]
MDGHDHPPWEGEGSLPSIQAEQFHDDSGRVSNILEFQPIGFPARVLTFAEFAQLLEDNWNSSQEATKMLEILIDIPQEDPGRERSCQWFPKESLLKIVHAENPLPLWQHQTDILTNPGCRNHTLSVKPNFVWNQNSGQSSSNHGNHKGLQTNIPLNARSPTRNLSHFSTEDVGTSSNNGMPDASEADDSYFEVPPHLKTTLWECVRQDSDDHKLPRIYGDLKKYLSKFVNIEVDIYATRRVAINRILAKIKDKTGLELDKRLINFLLGNLKRNYNMRFKHTNKKIFEGLNWDFTSFDARFPVFSGDKNIFDKWD